MKREISKFISEYDEYIIWIAVIMVWYILNSFFVRPYINPAYMDPDRHLPISEDDPSSLLSWSDFYYDDGEGYSGYSVNKWKDPKTNKIYHWRHPEVIKGERNEKIARVVVTAICGSLLLIFYCFRGEVFSQGLFLLTIASALSWSTSLIESILYTIDGILCLAVVVIPFLCWKAIKSFFKGEELKTEGK